MCFKQTANLLSLGTHVLPPRCTFVVRSLLIISSRDCREADSRDTSPRHACLGEVSRKIWLHDFAINNNGGSVPVIFISLERSNYGGGYFCQTCYGHWQEGGGSPGPHITESLNDSFLTVKQT